MGGSRNGKDRAPRWIFADYHPYHAKLSLTYIGNRCNIMHQLTNVQRPTAARADRHSARHGYTRMDDTARELLGTTCMPRSKTKCMRALLAENVPEPLVNVGRDPQGGERDGPQGGQPGTPRTTVR